MNKATGQISVTVSILCYNYGRYLGEAIESVLSWGVEPGVTLEILVLDDGSTDSTQAVCEHFAQYIRVHRTENRGFGKTISDAVELARGDYVFLLDADDFFLPDKLSTVVPYLREGWLWVSHQQEYMDASGARLEGIFPGGNTSTLCLHRESALALLPAQNEAVFHALKYAGRGITLSAPLSRYRYHTSSMTDRSQPGVQYSYLASVNQMIAEQLLTARVRPSWIASQRDLMRIVKEFESIAAYCQLEASLERGDRTAAYRSCLRMIRSSARSCTGLSIFTLKMAAKTLLGRPSFRRPR